MEKNGSVKLKHSEWRRIAKKERRKRLRREAARERDAEEERLMAVLEKDPRYLNYVKEQEEEEKRREAEEFRKNLEREEQWIEEEKRAKEQWEIIQAKKAKAREEQLKQEAKIREEFELKQRELKKKREDEQRKIEEEILKVEKLQKEIDDYIDSGTKTPEALKRVIDSQPGKELCPFFTKTGACRYGDACSRNHRRVSLSKVILIPGFYTHFSLEKNSAEYDTDVGLEFESSETKKHFREFYSDVITELENFGRIKTLKCCHNSEFHLRGNLYVEYCSEREAAKAWRKLKGRWYAGRQLNCEFVSLPSWRSAICGMAKCHKGRACNFLHTFRNPRDQYNIGSPPRRKEDSVRGIGNGGKSSHRSTKSSWEDIPQNVEESRNWRWSESPDLELPSSERTSKSKRRSRHGDDSKRNSQRRKRGYRSDEEDRGERKAAKLSRDDNRGQRRKSRSEKNTSRE